MNSVFRTWKFWVQFFGLKFWGRDLEKIKEKIKTVSKFRKCPKTFPSVQTCFGAIFSKTFFCPVFHGVIENFRKNQRNFKIAEMPRIVPKIVQTCFEHVLWNFFRKKNAPCSMEGRVFEKLQKNQKSFKIPKVPKVVFKSVQTCFKHALARFFRICLPSVPCRAFQIFWT